MKQELLDKLDNFLLKSGFTVRNLSGNCFDILARRQGQILLIKVLEDANSISRQHTDEMLNVAAYINASPLIITQKAGSMLEDNIVYSRFDVHTMNFDTFVNCVSNKFPFVRRSKAGLTASISGQKLREKREELGYSLNGLSKKVGVTSRMIIKYENENSEITISKAMKLYEIFGDCIFNEVDIFSQNSSPQSRFETEVSQKYVELGFKATETKKTPFDIIARKDESLILTNVRDKVNPHLQSLSKLLDAENLVIFEKKKPKNVPSLKKKEFMDFEKANELLRFLKEF